MNKRTKQVIWIIIISAVLLGTFYFLSSYEYVAGGGFARMSEIRFENIGATATIFVDGKMVAGKTNRDGFRTVSVRPGPHSVIVSATDSWPWMKAMDVKAGKSVAMSPFLLSNKPIIKVYSVRSEDHLSLSSKINASKKVAAEPKDASEIESAYQNRVLLSANINSHKTLGVWIEGNSVMAALPATPKCATIAADNCAKIISVMNTSKTPLNVFTYADRDDFAIVVFPEGVYAVEIAPETEFRNFEVIYSGNISKVSLDQGRLLLKDEKNEIAQVPITLGGM